MLVVGVVGLVGVVGVVSVVGVDVAGSVVVVVIVGVGGGGVVVVGSGVGVVAGGDGGSGGSDSIAPAQKFWSEIAPNFFSDSLISGLMNFTTDDKKRHLVKKKHIYNQDRFCYRKIFFLVPVPDELFLRAVCTLKNSQLGHKVTMEGCPCFS